MTITRTDDFNYSDGTPTPKPGDATHDSIAAQTAAFLAAGGKIQQIEIGVSAHPADGRHSAPLTAMQREKAKRGGRATLGRRKRPVEVL